VIRRAGSASPEAISAERTRSRASDTALSGSPTMAKAGNPGATYKTAWFMMHRIREAMRTGGLRPMGGSRKTVGVDETYIGRLEGQPAKAGPTTKNIVLTLVERGGSARSFHIDATSIAQVLPIIRENISRETIVMTGEAPVYRGLGGEYLSHDAVNHGAKEYVRYSADDVITTNTVEGFYSIFKRGMKGVYQHCKEKHLHRYLAEFDFRYSNRVALGVNDGERALLAMKGIEGKRLTSRPTNKAIG
jgi:hypothetical protein